MIFYSEKKKGRKSLFYKIITNQDGKETSIRQVEMPLTTIEKDGTVWFLLYDDDMKIIHEAFNYLNFAMYDKSLNTRKHAANSLRLLHSFLSLSNHDINTLSKNEIEELKKFLQGLNSNPSKYKTTTTRCNDTVNGFLATYREYFRFRKINCPYLFDARIVKESYTFDNDSVGTRERLKYSSNLKTADPNQFTTPPYISPSEFEQLYKLAVSKQDKEMMCMLRLGYCYGLRIGEANGLTIEDIKESHRDNELVPIIVLRNRISDNTDQYCKNLGHPKETKQYGSREYSKAKAEIVIDYDLYELLCDYINETHSVFLDKEKYDLSKADIVSYRNKPDDNHYIFLSSRGHPRQAQTFNKKLKQYFTECGIILDKDCRDNNLFHRLRHGFAMLHSHFRKDPIDVYSLMKMMRHASISSTMKYYNPTIEEEFKIKEDFVKDLYELIPSLKEGSDIFE